MADSNAPRDANRPANRPATRLTTRVYALRPERSRVSRLARAAFLVVLGAGAGVMALTSWHAHRGNAPTRCETPPVDEDAQQGELTRTRLALAQEAAARTAVQKTADKASAEVARLQDELQFLRGQSKAAPVRR